MQIVQHNARNGERCHLLAGDDLFGVFASFVDDWYFSRYLFLHDVSSG